MTLLSILIVATSLADQQADMIARVPANPTEDYSQAAGQTDSAYYDLLMALAQADAIIYFQDHKNVDWIKAGEVGEAHALKHHLIGSHADSYSAEFLSTFDALQTKE